MRHGDTPSQIETYCQLLSELALHVHSNEAIILQKEIATIPIHYYSLATIKLISNLSRNEEIKIIRQNRNLSNEVKKIVETGGLTKDSIDAMKIIEFNKKPSDPPNVENKENEEDKELFILEKEYVCWKYIFISFNSFW